MRLLILLFLLSSSTIFGQTVFEFAKKGDIEGIKSLGEEPASFYDQANDAGYTPLMLAAYYNKVEMIQYLLDKGANIDIASAYGTPLMAAVVKGHAETLDLLLEKGANPNIADENKSTALQYAVMFGQVNTTEKLLKNGADIHAKDNRGNKPLDYAILKQNEAIIKLLNKYL